jgi:hypothetical protein
MKILSKRCAFAGMYTDHGKEGVVGSKSDRGLAKVLAFWLVARPNFCREGVGGTKVGPPWYHPACGFSAAGCSLSERVPVGRPVLSGRLVCLPDGGAIVFEQRSQLVVAVTS